MGRKRQDGNPLGLERRVYWHHGQLRYKHRDGRWEDLGTDVDKANARAKVYNDPEGRYGTLAWTLDLFIAEAKAGRLLKKRAPRTIDDYDVQVGYLKAFFGKLLPGDLVENPNLIADYRDKRDAKVRANRELSLLSAHYAWLVESGTCPGIKTNPVLGIQRNPEKPKERYVEDSEYRAVYGIALRAVCAAMDLTYQTLQRPEDVLKMLRTAIRDKTVAGQSRKVVTVTQGKTGVTVDIEVTAELNASLDALIGGDVTPLTKHVIFRRGGKPYTVDGIGSMMRRYCKKANCNTYGLMDVRAKGATDMYLRGVPLEVIQLLMGHKSVQTTEIYIKRLMRTVSIATPNAAKAAS